MTERQRPGSDLTGLHTAELRASDAAQASDAANSADPSDSANAADASAASQRGQPAQATATTGKGTKALDRAEPGGGFAEEIGVGGGHHRLRGIAFDREIGAFARLGGRAVLRPTP